MPAESADADVVRRALLANNVDDVDGFLAALAEEVEWRSVGVFLHPARLWRGRAEVRRGLLAWREEHGGLGHVTLRELQARHGVVLAVAAVSVQAGRRSTSVPVAWVFEIEDRVAARVHGYRNETAARAAWASLSAARDPAA